MAPVEREGDQINNSPEEGEERARERKRMKGGHRRTFHRYFSLTTPSSLCALLCLRVKSRDKARRRSMSQSLAILGPNHCQCSRSTSAKVLFIPLLLLFSLLLCIITQVIVE
ncbi:hypothetical protein NQZ68_018968 [Dissostichus eleginoides]|nr:hypothetical protein NQZ68_018968 [Dissostichus eleginoides]